MIGTSILREAVDKIIELANEAEINVVDLRMGGGIDAMTNLGNIPTKVHPQDKIVLVFMGNEMFSKVGQAKFAGEKYHMESPKYLDDNGVNRLIQHLNTIVNRIRKKFHGEIFTIGPLPRALVKCCNKPAHRFPDDPIFANPLQYATMLNRFLAAHPAVQEATHFVPADRVFEGEFNSAYIRDNTQQGNAAPAQQPIPVVPPPPPQQPPIEQNPLPAPQQPVPQPEIVNNPNPPQPDVVNNGNGGGVAVDLVPAGADLDVDGDVVLDHEPAGADLDVNGDVVLDHEPNDVSQDSDSEPPMEVEPLPDLEQQAGEADVSSDSSIVMEEVVIDEVGDGYADDVQVVGHAGPQEDLLQSDEESEQPDSEDNQMQDLMQLLDQVQENENGGGGALTPLPTNS